MNAIAEYIKRQITLNTHCLHTMPIVVLMPHSRCNCRCVMCDIWKANKNDTELTVEDLQPHIEDMKRLNVRQIVLSGGEALMHSNLWTLCEAFAPLKTKITLLSTGLLLKKHAEPVVRWCDEVIVSLDGSQPVHDAIRRVPNAYARLAEGVAAIKVIDPTFRVTGRCVIQRENYADFANIIDAAHELELDEISFLAADVSTEAFNRPDRWDEPRVSEVALSPDETETFGELLEATFISHQHDFDSGFVAESPEKLRKIHQYYKALNEAAEFPAVTCNAPWVSAVIEADGTVRPCFFHSSLGNLSEGSIASILNSPQAITFRRNLDVSTDPICQKCVCSLNLSPRASV